MSIFNSDKISGITVTSAYHATKMTTKLAILTHIWPQLMPPMKTVVLDRSDPSSIETEENTQIGLTQKPQDL